MGSVTIVENGRDGRVHYAEGLLHVIEGYWEFGGHDVIAIVSMGSREEWAAAHTWALERRATILRYIADEVVRQRAPTCTAEIDVEGGAILLRQQDAGSNAVPKAPSPQVKAVTFARSYSKLKAMFGIGVLVVVIFIGGVLWLGKHALMVEPVSGVPLNECVRTDAHIASLIQTTDPHMVEISGRGGNTTTSLSILLIPLDGTEPFVVPFARGVDGQGYSLSRILGSDGRTLWFDCMGLHGVRLRDRKLVTSEDLMTANPSLPPRWFEDARGADIVDGKLHMINDDRSAALDIGPSDGKATVVDPKPSNSRFDRKETTDQLAAGLITPAGTWLGLHSTEEREGEFEVKSWIRRVEQAEDAKQLRRFCSAHLEASDDGDHFRILDMAPIGTEEYLNAAFLRMDPSSEPLRLQDPESVLMIHTDKPGLDGRLIVSRMGLDGKALWSVETGLDRFFVSQILPGTDAFAFVGTGPPIPNKLSEPFVVLVDNKTGKLTRHSLWR
ncbi:MAG: hypothetical protein JNL43_02205 [Flavobacteriales bacterium]|nr:hypothetical protein [Flavobacteriales bacterium]